MLIPLATRVCCVDMPSLRLCECLSYSTAAGHRCSCLVSVYHAAVYSCCTAAVRICVMRASSGCCWKCVAQKLFCWAGKSADPGYRALPWISWASFWNAGRTDNPCGLEL